MAQLVDHLPAVDGDLILDVGRLGDASPARPLFAVADAVVVVSGAELSAIDRAVAFSQSVSTSDAALHARLSVVVVGDSPWPQRELADVFGVPVVTAPYDKRSAAILSGSARPRGAWTRVGLPAAARTLALRLRTPAVDAKDVAAASSTSPVGAGAGGGGPPMTTTAHSPGNGAVERDVTAEVRTEVRRRLAEHAADGALPPARRRELTAR